MRGRGEIMLNHSYCKEEHVREKTQKKKMKMISFKKQGRCAIIIKREDKKCVYRLEM